MKMIHNKLSTKMIMLYNQKSPNGNNYAMSSL